MFNNSDTSEGEEVEIKGENSNRRLQNYPKEVNFTYIVKISIILSEFIAMFFMFSVFDAFVAFNYFPVSLKVVIFRILLVASAWIPLYFRALRLFDFSLHSHTKTTKWMILVLLAAALYSFGIVILVSGYCKCYYNTGIPGFHYDNTHLTTAFTRSMLPQTCPSKPKACMVYATLPENALSEVFINFHLNPES